MTENSMAKVLGAEFDRTDVASFSGRMPNIIMATAPQIAVTSTGIHSMTKRTNMTARIARATHGYVSAGITIPNITPPEACRAGAPSPHPPT